MLKKGTNFSLSGTLNLDTYNPSCDTFALALKLLVEGYGFRATHFSVEDNKLYLYDEKNNPNSNLFESYVDTDKEVDFGEYVGNRKIYSFKNEDLNLNGVLKLSVDFFKNCSQKENFASFYKDIHTKKSFNWHIFWTNKKDFAICVEYIDKGEE